MLSFSFSGRSNIKTGLTSNSDPTILQSKIVDHNDHVHNQRSVWSAVVQSVVSQSRECT